VPPEEYMEQARGIRLDTPLSKVRVFHISNPAYTYRFVRQNDAGVTVADDHGEREKLKSFPANDLVNVAVLEELRLTALKNYLERNNSPLPRSDP